MNPIRDCVRELFEIAGRDFFLAKAILEKSKLEITFEEITIHCGSRSPNIQLFTEEVLDHVCIYSLNKDVLIKKIKEPVLMRSNVCIYLLLKYKTQELTAKDIFLLSNKNSWERNAELISLAASAILLPDNIFSDLVEAYTSGNSIIRQLAEQMLLRLPVTGIDFDYINKNKSNSLDYVGKICRLLLLKHYELNLSNDEILRMYRKDYGSNRPSYLNILEARVATKIIPRTFWEKCFDSNYFELHELAYRFLPEYELSKKQEAEMKLFLNKFSS